MTECFATRRHEITVAQYGRLWEVRHVVHTSSHLGEHSFENGAYTYASEEKAQEAAAELRKMFI